MKGGSAGRVSAGGALATLLGLGLLLLLVAATVPSCVTYVDPGSVGIVIHRAGGGVDPTPLGPGFHLRNPLTTGIEEYPTYMQTLILTQSVVEGVTAQRRDQRQQRGGAAVVARRLDVVRAGPGTGAGAVHHVPE
jgi:hypothetical protein